MSLRHYVYYRVAATDLAAAVSAVRTAQADLRARHPGLVAECLRRPEAPDGAVTLMETYHFADAHDVAAIERAAAAASARWRQGERHLERFVQA